jgi:hypothetical protein
LRSLLLHPEIRAINEPFNPHFYGGYFNAVSCDGEELLQSLDFLAGLYLGCKHVWEPDGWPFTKSMELNKSMLLGSSQKIIFLKRRNVLQRQVSQYIAHFTGYWHDYHYIHGKKIPAMDISILSESIELEMFATSKFETDLSQSNIPTLSLDYADLFSNSGDLPRLTSTYGHILDFIGFDAHIQMSNCKLLRILGSESIKCAQKIKYSVIENFEEINTLLGSDKNGFLIS